MPKKRMPVPALGLVVAAPDEATAACLARALGAAGLRPAAVATREKDLVEAAKRAAAGPLPALLLAPSSVLGMGQLAAVDSIAAGQGVALVWEPHRVRGSESVADQVIAAALAAQRGALAARRLPVLVEALRLVQSLGAPPPRLRIAGKTSALCDRLIAHAEHVGLNDSGTGERWTLSVAANGTATLAAGRGTELAVDDADLALEAMELLAARTAHVVAELEAAAPPPRAEVVDHIVRPPGRLLSETTSKKLLAAFGIRSPKEQLCGSVSEAVRSAALLDGPVVLKLVRPALEGKQGRGAVRLGVTGAAAVRRAAHELTALGKALGPPASLGVLVAEQIPGGARLSAVLRDHPRFGRLVAINAGDEPREQELVFLRAPPTPQEAYGAILRAGIAPPGRAAAALAVAVSRFGGLAAKLGPRIDRAEVHPLAAREADAEALALDALVGIAGAPC